jgi:NADP-dependent 3-hydroxy acid dehydrogenase YdfG
MKEFKNKIVLITGGGTGIGRDSARAFLQQGAKVVLNGRRENVLAETAREIDPSGKNAATVVGDIGTRETSTRLVQTAVEKFGGVDILINNAGIFKPTPFLEHTEADYNSYINIILGGTFYASQAVIPEMQKRGAVQRIFSGQSGGSCFDA